MGRPCLLGGVVGGALYLYMCHTEERAKLSSTSKELNIMKNMTTLVILAAALASLPLACSEVDSLPQEQNEGEQEAAQGAGANLYEPPACLSESCLPPGTREGELGPLTLVTPERIDDGAECPITVGMCSFASHGDVLVVASYSSPLEKIPYSCEEPGRYGQNMYLASLEIRGVIGNAEVPDSLNAIMPNTVKGPEDAWEGDFLFKLRFIDGEWFILSRLVIGTPDAMQESIGIPADNCLVYDVPPSFDDFVDGYNTTVRNLREVCPELADQQWSDAYLHDMYVGRTPTCPGEPQDQESVYERGDSVDDSIPEGQDRGE